MEINEYILRIKKLGACSEAVKDAHNYKTSQELWDDCKRGDWMLWNVGKHAGDPWSDKRKPLVTVSCQCARLAWDLMKQPSKDCIVLFEKWANGENIPKEDLLKAKRDAAAADAAAYAAYAAADAAAYAAYAADAAAYAAYAVDAAAKKKVLMKCANIVREQYPNVDNLFKKE